MDGIDQGYVEPDEDEQMRNFEKEYPDGFEDWFDLDDEPESEDEISEDEKKEEFFGAWRYLEQLHLGDHDLEWIRARHSVDDSVYLDEDEELNYVCFIPKDFLPASQEDEI